jgi:small subunit ribosomal protein S16
MIKIRLKRMGAKKQPYYRIVVVPERSPRDGEAIERLGTYDPRSNPPKYEVKAEKAIHWLSRGAQPTDIVRNIFRKTGVYQQWRASKAEAASGQATAEASAAQKA